MCCVAFESIYLSIYLSRLAVCGDFLRPRPSPLEAAAESGLEAGERVAGWLREQDGGVA